MRWFLRVQLFLVKFNITKKDALIGQSDFEYTGWSKFCFIN